MRISQRWGVGMSAGGSVRQEALKARGWEDYPFVERGHRDTYAKPIKRLQENERRRRQMAAGVLRAESRGVGHGS